MGVAGDPTLSGLPLGCPPSLCKNVCFPLKKKSGQAFKGGVLLKEEEHDGLALIMFKMLKNQVPLRQTLSPSR